MSPAPPRQTQQHILTVEASLCPMERSPLDDWRGRGDEAGWPRGALTALIWEITRSWRPARRRTRWW